MSENGSRAPGQGGLAKGRVLVLGGGFGGLETAFDLRRRVGRRAEIALVSDQDHFLFKPNSIYVPFGLNPDRLEVPLARPTARRGIEFIEARVHEVDPDARKVQADGRTLDYDRLVIATGSDMRPREIPGLAEHATTMWTPEEMLRLRDRFNEVLEAARAGRHQRIVFLIPPNNKCAGPLYEIVLMFETWLRRRGGRDATSITWATYEDGYIQAFGPRLHELVTDEFERRGIEGHISWAVERVDSSGVEFHNAEGLDHDLLVAFPPYVAAAKFPRLPGDDRGFLATDLATRRLADHPEIYVVGDAGDFPVKQAFLAFLQADAVASQIAAEILDTEPELTFDPVSMCIMEQFDKATFAKVPLRLTGDSSHPVEVRADADGAYRVGSGRIWRMGKKMLGTTVPWRFRHGKPFHGGPFWSTMDVGLRAMSGAFSD
jgi:sulfide:quinone oxidoreductase